jgi:hypothetical protein
VSSVSICVSMSHPLLIQIQKWRSRAKFSRGKPLPFYKCELKIHRFLVHHKWCARRLDTPLNDLSQADAHRIAIPHGAAGL